MLVAILAALGGLSAGAAALQQQQQKPLNVRAIQKMRDDLYFISGGELNERAIWTGGNSMVLRWVDIDFAGRFIAVNRNIVRGVLTSPKSHSGRSPLSRYTES